MLNTTTNAPDSPYLTWTPDLLIGNELIDADHQALFEVANRLQAEILGEEPEYSIVGEVLVELIEHTGSHFQNEEQLMQEIDFPAYEEHKLQHKVLMDKVNGLHRRYMDGRGDMAADVAEFLQKWLLPHIHHADMELGRGMRAAK